MNDLVRSKYLVGFYESLGPQNVKKEQVVKKETNEIQECSEEDVPEEVTAASPKIDDIFSLNIDNLLNSPSKPASPEAQPVDDTESSVTVEEDVQLPSPKPVSKLTEEPSNEILNVDEPAPPVKKYKPGPRSRTKPHVAPVRDQPLNVSLVSSPEVEADLTTSTQESRGRDSGAKREDILQVTSFI